MGERAVLAAQCCNDQLVHMTLMSTLSFFASDSAMVVYGECMDRLGPKATFMAASWCSLIGLLLIALNAELNIDLLWFGAFIMLGVGGPGIFMGFLVFAEVWPETRCGKHNQPRRALVLRSCLPMCVDPSTQEGSNHSTRSFDVGYFLTGLPALQDDVLLGV